MICSTKMDERMLKRAFVSGMVTKLETGISVFLEIYRNLDGGKKFELLQPDEEKALNDMLRSMLVLEPAQRATIGQVVRCEWMQNWGLSEVQKMRDITDYRIMIYPTGNI